jgi:hypothetical protein
LCAPALINPLTAFAFSRRSPASVRMAVFWMSRPRRRGSGRPAATGRRTRRRRRRGRPERRRASRRRRLWRRPVRPGRRRAGAGRAPGDGRGDLRPDR